MPAFHPITLEGGFSCVQLCSLGIFLFAPEEKSLKNETLSSTHFEGTHPTWDPGQFLCLKPVVPPHAHF